MTQTAMADGKHLILLHSVSSLPPETGQRKTKSPNLKALSTANIIPHPGTPPTSLPIRDRDTTLVKVTDNTSPPPTPGPLLSLSRTPASSSSLISILIIEGEGGGAVRLHRPASDVTARVYDRRQVSPP